MIQKLMGSEGKRIDMGMGKKREKMIKKNYLKF